MASSERTGVRDFGQVEFIDVTPEVSTPDVPLPDTPPDASPVQHAQDATIETTGADPPPERAHARLATPPPSAPPLPSLTYVSALAEGADGGV